MVLRVAGQVSLPQPGGFDHGGVYEANGWVYVAHTSAATVEAFDGVTGRLVKTVPGCQEASGVVCAQADGLVLAACRGSGKALVINAGKATLMRTVQAGAKPNGAAWDDDHGLLLLADVGDLHARLIDPVRGEVLKTVRLPGRPRWCVYSPHIDAFVINLREPAAYVTLSPRSGSLGKVVPVPVAGPHGIDLDETGREAFIACDGGAVVSMDLEKGTEVTRVKIPGEPDVAWFNPRRKLLYCALAKPGSIVSVDTVEMKVVQEVRTEEGAGTLAFDRSRQRLYSFLPKSCKAVVYEEK